MGMGRRNLTKVRLVSSVILSVVGEGLRGKHVRVPPSIERGMPRPRPHSSPSSLCGIKGEGEGQLLSSLSLSLTPLAIRPPAVVL